MVGIPHGRKRPVPPAVAAVPHAAVGVACLLVGPQLRHGSQLAVPRDRLQTHLAPVHVVLIDELLGNDGAASGSEAASAAARSSIGLSPAATASTVAARCIATTCISSTVATCIIATSVSTSIIAPSIFTTAATVIGISPVFSSCTLHAVTLLCIPRPGGIFAGCALFAVAHVIDAGGRRICSTRAVKAC